MPKKKKVNDTDDDYLKPMVFVETGVRRKRKNQNKDAKKPDSCNHQCSPANRVAPQSNAVANGGKSGPPERKKAKKNVKTTNKADKTANATQLSIESFTSKRTTAGSKAKETPKLKSAPKPSKPPAPRKKKPVVRSPVVRREEVVEGHGRCNKCNYNALEKAQQKNNRPSQQAMMDEAAAACDRHCTYCDYWAVQAAKVKKHIDDKHPMRCDLHHIAFTSPEEKADHMADVHKLEYHFCRLCESICRTERSWKSHEKTKGHTSRDRLDLIFIGVLKKMGIIDKDCPLGATDTRINWDLPMFDKPRKEAGPDFRSLVIVHERPSLKELRKWVQNKAKGKQKTQKATTPQPEAPVQVNHLEPVARNADGAVEMQPGDIVANVLAALSPSSRTAAVRMVNIGTPSPERPVIDPDMPETSGSAGTVQPSIFSPGKEDTFNRLQEACRSLLSSQDSLSNLLG